VKEKEKREEKKIKKVVGGTPRPHNVICNSKVSSH